MGLKPGGGFGYPVVVQYQVCENQRQNLQRSEVVLYQEMLGGGGLTGGSTE